MGCDQDLSSKICLQKTEKTSGQTAQCFKLPIDVTNPKSQTNEKETNTLGLRSRSIHIRILKKKRTT